MIYACKQGNLDIVKSLLKEEVYEYEINKTLEEKDKKGKTALRHAYERKYFNIVKYLRKKERMSM